LRAFFSDCIEVDKKKYYLKNKVVKAVIVVD
jgi:hypothetical protein